MLVKCPSCGGRIRVEQESKEKLISYFCPECQHIVKLDLLSDEIPTSSSPSPAKYCVDAQRFRVLVVDDSVAFARTAEGLLKSDGYEVILAHDGVDALKKILEERPDLVVLDLAMPRMTGFEVLRLLKTNPGYKNFRSLPILVTSGVYHTTEIEMIHDLGANGFLRKEAIYDLLLYRVKQLLPQSLPILIPNKAP